MEWKTFGKKGRLSSAKDQMVRVFRLIRGSETAYVNVSSCTDANEDPRQPINFNSQAQIIAKKRMLEIQAQKAMLISELRHDRWKAGGPV